ncbi:hypothetical protein C8R43DRAFT_1243838 [Mycena crocata]|nr:hypothetical protein C8R43DRAFT_1243838 [Mycena crocata]
MESVEGQGWSIMPAWSEQWHSSHFQPIKRRVEELHTKLKQRDIKLKQSVQDIHTKLDTLSARSLNTLRDTVHQVPFDVVPFISGDVPCEIFSAPYRRPRQHNLPPILTIYDIIYLDAGDITAYLTGYGLSAQGDRIAHNRRLAQHIGYNGDL